MQAEVAALQQRVAGEEGEVAALERQLAQAKQGASVEVVTCLAVMVRARSPTTRQCCARAQSTWAATIVECLLCIAS